MTEVDRVRGEVQKYLQNNFDVIELHGEAFFVRSGSTGVDITVAAWGKSDVMIRLSSLVLSDVERNDEFYIELGKRSGVHIFGNLHAIPNEDERTCCLYFEHNLLGTTLDEGELMWALSALAQTADEMDDELQALFGGKRLIDGRGDES